MNRLDTISPTSPDLLDALEPSAPSTESVTRVINPNRLRAISDAWRKLGQAAVMFVATTSSPCFPLPYRNRLGFSPDETATVVVYRTMPVRRRITLGEARRLSLETIRLADRRRQAVVTEQARRNAFLESLL